VKAADLLIEHFKLPLKAAGYRKTGQHWHKRNGEIALVVNVQQSRWNNWAYVNCGVYVGQSEDFNVPKEYDCHIRFRLENVVPGVLGDLVHGKKHELLSELPKGLDSTEADAIAQALTEYGVPFLSKFETKEKIRNLIAARDHGSTEKACLFTHQLTEKISI
jgi:hypothetical protein